MKYLIYLLLIVHINPKLDVYFGTIFVFAPLVTNLAVEGGGGGTIISLHPVYSSLYKYIKTNLTKVSI